MTQEPLDLKCLLGEFEPYYHQSTNFKKLIHLTLIYGEMSLYNGDLERAKQNYYRLLNYMEAVKARPDIRKRELTPISFQELIQSNVTKEMDAIIKEYMDSLP